ncbi:uncharacterized protein N7479_008650 [Penicillium vulpinum]|uniref:Uncharacterized protein n=1 Tax=Penicillium vulpinum TaxID=29845 RepID=A0A1V6S0T4_9EURO|nr:uncharacterized protein N7479_008650 [Penicillium vulpinum]KAJ5950237.1 hypothetical protein N7479_008650 [Penicillium vulpinum]OQE07637.1 hypothetical protein PENVUL_c012G06959 [Penicillium vulpinum]
MVSTTTQEVLMYPKLAVEALPLSAVERIFHLARIEDTDWEDTDWALLRAPLEIADHCTTILKMVEAAISRSDGRPDIAVRLRLGILLTTIYATPPNPHSPNLTPIPMSSKSPFLFGPVVYKEKTHHLQGSPDWFLWYGPYAEKEKENVAINSVIVETEHGRSTDGVPQALAYMGMIHTQRRAEGKVDSSVFGLSTDNDQFHFLTIDDKSEWSQLDLNYVHHFQEIVERLAYFHKHASTLSASDHSDEPQRAQSVFHAENRGIYAVLVAFSSNK